MTQFERLILGMIARDEAAEATAEQICRRGQSFTDDVLCSMVTVDRAGHLHPFAGPGLPPTYSAALDGIPIGPHVGSCGSAAFLRQPVAVTDIFADHRWGPYRRLAEPLGMKACWSSPILAGNGRPLGAFGFYYRDHRGPNRGEEELVAECVGLSAILLDRWERSAEVERLAVVDGLTGFGNRTGFERALHQVSLGRGAAALLLADVDGLRRINDAFGHATGDRLIREVARRLRRAVPHARLFRITAGTFALLIEGADVGVGLSRIAARIAGAMRPPAWCGPHLLAPAVTCGAATFDGQAERDPERLRQDADLALRQAKETARGGFVCFRPERAAAAIRRRQGMQAAARALAEDRLEAHYQPIVRLGTRQVIGVEALCRLRTPDGRLLPSGHLAEALRSPSNASLVTDRMLARVARDVRAWLDQGIHLQHVGVNLSQADFRQGDLVARITAALAQYDVPRHLVVLEVTETVELDDGGRTVGTAIERLRNAGLRVALDDFGTGYASLAHLLDIQVDIVKTDKSLMRRFAVGDTGEVLLTALLQMADGLGFQLLAEGVETAAQAIRLEQLGCPLAQGFLFGPPRTAAVTAALLPRAAPAGSH